MKGSIKVLKNYDGVNKNFQKNQGLIKNYKTFRDLIKISQNFERF